MPNGIQRTICTALLIGLAWLYVGGAREHARTVNTFKARGDQSGYLWDAEQVYANWHGRRPPALVGERNRMPLYAAYQALFYTPRLSDAEFFEVAKTANIWSSVVLLALLAAIFAWYLPPLISTNLTLIVAFGYFVFKAGYVQSELLFYVLCFATFLAFCRLLRAPTDTRSLLLGAMAGMLAGLAQLTKAAMLPLVAIFLTVDGVRALGSFRRSGHFPVKRAAAGALVLACFVAVLYPYISNSKRAFGHYFYNVNTTFYAWYDNWPEASVGTIKYGDGVGWPTMPAAELPGMRKYLREHTIGQMVDRLSSGFQDMVSRSYQMYWYVVKYVTFYALLAAILIASNWRSFSLMIREHAAPFMFMLLYSAVYLAAIAFYAPISGTGTTRFLLAHVAPVLFILSCFFARSPFRDTQWTIAGASVTPAHFHALVLIMLMADLAFSFWPRLMSTYGGF